MIQLWIENALMGTSTRSVTVTERFRLVQGTDSTLHGEYSPEQQAERVKQVGCAVCARYSVWVSCLPLATAPAKARRREARANRGGTAKFRPLPNSHLAGAFLFALAASSGGNV